jgi:O-antigen ligase
VVRSRLQMDPSSSTHLAVYAFVPDALSSHPLLGLGLNNFAVQYQLTTGRGDFGPHSFFVAVVVETGLLGACVFGAFIAYLFARIHTLHKLGRGLAAAGDASAARVRQLAWGLTAAVVATIAANAFYLTMQFFYFYVLALVAVATPTVLSRSANASRRRLSNAASPCSRFT